MRDARAGTPRVSNAVLPTRVTLKHASASSLAFVAPAPEFGSH
jgi:hypothetical protein